MLPQLSHHATAFRAQGRRLSLRICFHANDNLTSPVLTLFSLLHTWYIVNVLISFTTLFHPVVLTMIDHGVAGCLGEGECNLILGNQCAQTTEAQLDGIHVDMNRLKSGEVKYGYLRYNYTVLSTWLTLVLSSSLGTSM